MLDPINQAQVFTNSVIEDDFSLPNCLQQFENEDQKGRRFQRLFNIDLIGDPDKMFHDAVTHIGADIYKSRQCQ